MLRSIRLAFVLVLLVCGAANAAHKPDEIIVKYKPGFRAQVLSSRALRGARVLRSIDQIRLHTLKLPPGLSLEEAIQAYRKDPRVEYVGPNHIVSICRVPNDDWYQLMGYYLQWGLYDPDYPEVTIEAEPAWDLTTGSSSIIIANVDTGVMTDHEDLWAKIVPGRNVITGAPDPDNPYDDHGHGTFTAGVSAAMTDNIVGVAGVSWGAKIMPIKALDADGYGTEADAAAGIVWAADHGAKIINMSFGGYDDVPAELDAVNYAAAKGCILVGASGNDGSSQPFFPAAYDQVIAVGATNEYGQRCTAADWGEGGSNYGSYLDVVAPGNNILSTYGDGSYTMASGTSAAAPFVSGIAALVWSYHPDWTRAQVIEQIKTTCRDVSPAGWDQYTGWGIANAYRALTMAPIQTVTIGQLNSISGGTPVRVRDAVVTSGSTDIPGRMYVEQADRACAVQLLFASNPAGFAEGDIVEVSGTLMTVEGERSIQGATLVKTGTRAPLSPLGISQRYIGGTRNGLKSGITGGVGTNNVSLLVTVWGRVTAVSAYDYLYVDDGSGRDDGTGLVGLKVSCGSLAKPAKGSFVRVTGISSVERPFGPNYSLPVLRVRRQSDIRVLP